MDNILYNFPHPTSLQKNLDVANISLSKNTKLQKLVKNVKIKKKPSKQVAKFKSDPTYVNVEHLVYGCYRPSPKKNESIHSSDKDISASSQDLELKSYLNSSFFVPSLNDQAKDIENAINVESPKIAKIVMTKSLEDSQTSVSEGIKLNYDSSEIELRKITPQVNGSLNNKSDDDIHNNVSYLEQIPNVLTDWQFAANSMEGSVSSKLEKHSGFTKEKEIVTKNFQEKDYITNKGSVDVFHSYPHLINENNTLINGKISPFEITKEKQCNTLDIVNTFLNGDIRNENLNLSFDINHFNFRLVDNVNASSSGKIRSFSEPLNPYIMGNILNHNIKDQPITDNDKTENNELISNEEYSSKPKSDSPCLNSQMHIIVEDDDSSITGNTPKLMLESINNNENKSEEVKSSSCVKANINATIQENKHASYKSASGVIQSGTKTPKVTNAQKMPQSKISRLRPQSDSSVIESRKEVYDSKNRKMKCLSEPVKKLVPVSQKSESMENNKKFNNIKKETSSIPTKTDFSGSKLNKHQPNGIIPNERKISKSSISTSNKVIHNSNITGKAKTNKKSEILSTNLSESIVSITNSVIPTSQTKTSIIESNNKFVTAPLRSSMRVSTEKSTSLPSKDKPKLFPKPTGLQNSNSKLSKTCVESTYLQQKTNETTSLKSQKSINRSDVKNISKPVLPPKPPLNNNKLSGTSISGTRNSFIRKTGVPITKSASVNVSKTNNSVKVEIQKKNVRSISMVSSQKLKPKENSQTRRRSLNSPSPKECLSRQSSIASSKSVKLSETNKVLEISKVGSNEEKDLIISKLHTVSDDSNVVFDKKEDLSEAEVNTKQLNAFISSIKTNIVFNPESDSKSDVHNSVFENDSCKKDFTSPVLSPANDVIEEIIAENISSYNGPENTNSNLQENENVDISCQTSFVAFIPPPLNREAESKIEMLSLSMDIIDTEETNSNFGNNSSENENTHLLITTGVQGKPPTGKPILSSPSFKRSVATVSLYRKENSDNERMIKQLDLSEIDSAFLIEAFGDRKKSASLPRSFLSQTDGVPSYKLTTVYRGIWPNRLQPPTAMERLYPGGIPRGPILNSLFINKQDNNVFETTDKISNNKKFPNANIEVHIEQEINTTNVNGSLTKTSSKNESQESNKEPQESEVQDHHVTQFTSSTPSSAVVSHFPSEANAFSPVVQPVPVSSADASNESYIPSLIPPTAYLSEFECDLSPQESEISPSIESKSQTNEESSENMAPNRIRFEGVDVPCVDNVASAVPRKLAMSRIERWKRALSSPILRSSPNLQSGIEQRRPWSEVFTEKDASKILESKFSRQRPGSLRTPSCNDIDMSNSRSLDRDLKYYSKFGSFDGNRQVLYNADSSFTTPRTNIHDGFFQRFRKSFSLRFSRSKLRDLNNLSPTPKDNMSDHDLGTINEHKMKKKQSNNLSETGKRSASTINVVENGLEQSISPESNSDNEILSRFGSLIYRVSKHKKKSKDKKDKVVKSHSADSGIQIEVLRNISTDNFVRHSVFRRSDSSVPPPQTSSSSVVFRQKAYLHDRPRPISDLGGLSLIQQANRASTSNSDGLSMQRSLTDLASGESLNDSSGSIVPKCNQGPPTVSSRPDLRMPRIKKGALLRRSHSHPVDMDKIGIQPTPFITGQSSFVCNESTVSSEDESEDLYCPRFHFLAHSVGGTPLSQSVNELNEIDPPIYAEALWDHVTLDPEELPFKIGDVIKVTDRTNKEWWWGTFGGREGWFPALFVRPRVNQEETVEDCVAKMKEGKLISKNMKDMSVSLLSNDQVRTNVINEIISTERNFVQHLKDVIEGYLKECRKRPDMFPDECIATVFGNIEQIYEFQSKFLANLEECINWDYPHLSQIGQCFLNHKQGFEIYSEYCNNHPQACSELQELYRNAKYRHFFEACRLLQEMIDISLDGFLLTPVQKICKYPLQLAELLKYTKPDHQDYIDVGEALSAMRCVAQLINERKRRIECLEKLALWQKSVDDWEGPDLLETCSELIYSGDVHKVSSTWPREFTFFLFDHQLIYCKKDLLKRNAYTYKGRIDMDNCDIIPIEDGKDAEFNMSVKHAWKIHNIDKGKWYLVYVKSSEEKLRWMKAFLEERKRVIEDKDNGFCIPESARKAAMATSNKIKPKKPKGKNSDRHTRWKHLYTPGEITENSIRRNTHLSPSIPHQDSLGSSKKKAWSLFSARRHKR